MVKIAPIQAAATSDRLGWVGLEAERYRATPAAEFSMPALTHHWLALFIRPRDGLPYQIATRPERTEFPPTLQLLTPVGVQHRKTVAISPSRK
jgi:hypothetical protein